MSKARDIADISSGIDIDGAITSDGLTVDTNTLHVDAANNRVGIKTSSPSTDLDVAGGIRSTSSGGYNQIITTSIGDAVFNNNGNNWLTVKDGVPANAMRIDSSGYVGINNASPASPLSVGGNTPTAGELSVVGASGGIALALSDNVSSSLYVRTATGGAIIGTDAGGDLRFASGGNTAAEERIRISGNGNVLLGTTSTFDNVSLLTTQAVGGVATKIAGTGAASQMSFFNDNGRVGFILTSGTSTSYSTSSDYRLKTDVQPMAGASARVQALKPVNFEWIADGTRVDGFLAHELQDVVPEAATGTKDAVDADGNPEYQGIDQSKLVPLLTAALQEALTKIDDMETRLAALEAV